MKSGRYLILDLDDTLIPSSRFYDQAMREIGIEPDDEQYLLARREVKELVPSTHPSSHSRLLYFKRYIENTRDRLDPSLVLELAASYETALLRLVREFWLESGRHDLLLNLKVRWERVALLTNESVRIQLMKLQALQPSDALFDVVVISEEVGVDKPAAAAFAECLRRLDARPDEAVMAGDSVINDIIGANHAGLTAVWVTEYLSTAAIQKGRTELGHLGPSFYTEIQRAEELLSL